MPTSARAAAKKSAKPFLCWRAPAVLSLAAGFLSLLAEAAFARAGGGGSYGGGSHGGGFSSGGGYSGGSSGGGGIGDLIYLDLRFTIAYPEYGLPINAAIIALYIVTHMKTRDAVVDYVQDRTIYRGAGAQKEKSYAENLAAICSRDPGFDVDRFIARVSAAFVKIQESWSAQNMSTARTFVSDGIFERFSIQIAMLADDGVRNQMDQVRVLSARILQIGSDERFDAIHVRINASAIDTDVSVADGRRLRGGDPEEFEEVWSFLRRPGAKTLIRPGTLEGACPECGADIGPCDAALCPSCKSWVNSGAYDWVLSEITQMCEWSTFEAKEIQGYPQAVTADPELDVQFLEDRASVAFWLWQCARRKGDIRFFQSVAMDDCCGDVEKSWNAGRKLIFKEIAVGGTEVLAVDRTPALEKAHVMIKWSADFFEERGSSLGNGDHGMFSHVLVLARKHGLHTDARAGFSSLRCPSCGAPPSDRAQPVCQYCGTHLNDGSLSWVVSEVIPGAMWRRPPAPQGSSDSDRLEKKVQMDGSSRAAYLPPRPGDTAPPMDPRAATHLGFERDAWSWAVSPIDALAVFGVIMAGGKGLTEDEMSQMKAYGSRHGVPEERLADIISAAAAGRIELPHPSNPQEAQACLRGMVRLSLANGGLTKGEKRAMLAFGAKFKLTPPQLHNVFKSEKEDAYRRAKAVLSTNS